MLKHALPRYLCTVPLYSLLIMLMIWQNWSDALHMALLPVFVGGLFLLGLIGGVFWGGLPGLRWRTFFLYVLLSQFAFPLPYWFYMPDEPGVFWLLFLCLNGQQTAGFALGAWFRITDIRFRSP